MHLGLNVQNNQFNCNCELLWMKNWMERWLRESRKAQLINHEHYLKNYQNVEQVTCTEKEIKKFKHSRIESPIKLDFLKLLPYTLDMKETNKIEHLDKKVNREVGIINLNGNDLKCSTSSSTLNELNAIIKYLLFILISKIIFKELYVSIVNR